MLTRIHVNQHVIKSNRKNKQTRPVISVKTSRTTRYGSHVKLTGPSEVVYSPNKPLSCGATVWIETKYPVEVKNKK